MFEGIKRFTTPPHFENTDKNRIANILHTVAWSIFIGMVSLALFRALTKTYELLAPLMIVLVLLVIVIITNRKGYVRFAASLISWTLFVFLIYLITKYDGIHDTAMFGIPGVIILSSLVLDKRYFFSFVTIILLTIAGITCAEVSHLTFYVIKNKATYSDLIDLLVILAITSITIRLLAEHLVASIKQAKISEERIRKQSEQLQKSEEKFSKAFLASPSIMSITRFSDLAILDVNLAFEKLSGYARSEVMGKTIAGLELWVDPLDQTRTIQTLLEKGNIYNKEYLFRNKSREIKICNLSAEIINLDGVECILTSIIDQTERRRAEDALRESEELYKSLLDVLPEGVAVTDLSGKITFISQKMVSLYGASSASEAIGTNALNWIAPEFRDKAIKNLNGLIKNKVSGDKQYKLLRKDGTEFMGEISGSLLNDKEGFPKGFVTVHRDITDKLKAENENILLAQTLKSVKDCVSITDLEDTIIFVNDAFMQVYGYDKSELIGKKISEIRANDNSIHSYDEILRDTLNGGWHGELVNKTKDGHKFPVELWTSLVKDSKGNSIAMVGVARDISDRKKADRLKDEFLAQISHEIRTPLNIMLSYSQLMKSELDGQVTDSIENSFAAIESAGNRIIRTVDLILNMSELQTGTYEACPMKFDLVDNVLSYEFANHYRFAKSKNLSFELNVQTENTKVKADEYSMHQIFNHLIDNAIKYTKNGYVKIDVRTDDKDRTIVEISDSGIGISEEFLPKLFMPFAQEEQGYTRTYEGNGLGLALVKKFAEINNLTVQVVSKKKVGSKFTVKFN